MTAEERIAFLKTRPTISIEERKRKVVTAIVWALSVLVSLIFLVYAFHVQNASEQRLKDLQQQVERLEKENERLRELLP